MDRSAGASGGRDARSDVLVDSRGVPHEWPDRFVRLTRGLQRRDQAGHALVAIERGINGARDSGAVNGGAGTESEESAPSGWQWIGATGVADGSGEAMTPQSRFFIASISKMFVATVALKMYERGQLRLCGRLCRDGCLRSVRHGL